MSGKTGQAVMFVSEDDLRFNCVVAEVLPEEIREKHGRRGSGGNADESRTAGTNLATLGLVHCSTGLK